MHLYKMGKMELHKHHHQVDGREDFQLFYMSIVVQELHQESHLEQVMRVIFQILEPHGLICHYFCCLEPSPMETRKQCLGYLKNFIFLNKYKLII